jgi:dipeptidase E
LGSQDKKFQFLELFEDKSEEALNFTNFYIRPHFQSDYFPWASKEYLQERAKEISAKIYALDDNSALKVVDGTVEIISEGEYLELN